MSACPAPVGVQMGLEREEFDELAAKRPTAGTDRKVLAGLAQAALKMEAVTSDASWDTYLSYIQRAIEVAQGQKKAAIDRVSSPQLVNPDHIAAVRNEILLCGERIRVLEIVVNMPAEIKRVGGDAKKMLAALEAQDADGEVPDAA